MNERIISTDKYKVTIFYDDDTSLYEDLWDGVSFLSNHRNYDSIGPDAGANVADIDEYFYDIVPITAYIHGDITLAASFNTGVNCQFDSGFFGYLVFKKGEFGNNNKGLDGFINMWCDLLNGNIYSFCLQGITSCKHCNNHIIENIDSCGGYIGSLGDCLKMFLNDTSLEIENKNKLIYLV